MALPLPPGVDGNLKAKDTCSSRHSMIARTCFCFGSRPVIYAKRACLFFFKTLTHANSTWPYCIAHNDFGGSASFRVLAFGNEAHEVSASRNYTLLIAPQPKLLGGTNRGQIYTHTHTLSKKPRTPPKKAWGFPAERTKKFQAPIKLARPFPAPELQAEELRT